MKLLHYFSILMNTNFVRQILTHCKEPLLKKWKWNLSFLQNCKRYQINTKSVRFRVVLALHCKKGKYLTSKIRTLLKKTKIENANSNRKRNRKNSNGFELRGFFVGVVGLSLWLQGRTKPTKKRSGSFYS